MQTSLSFLPELIISNVEQTITTWAVAQKENFKPYEDVVITDKEGNEKRVGDIMDVVIADFANNVTSSIRSKVSRYHWVVAVSILLAVQVRRSLDHVVLDPVDPAHCYFSLFFQRRIPVI